MTTPATRPGIYITEEFNPLQSNAGIPGESTPAFAAVHPRGPLEPTLIRNWQEFTRLYGDFSTPNTTWLPFAVNGFFANGGNECFVLRIPNTDATSSSLACVNIDPGGAETVMTFTAQSPGVWGQKIYVELSTAKQTGRFNVNIYYGGSSSVYLVETFQDLSINPTDPRYVTTLVNSPLPAGSKYVTLKVTFPTGIYRAGVDDPLLISPTALQSGSDGSTPPTMGASTLPNPSAADGWFTDAVTFGFDKLDEQVLCVNCPGITDVPTLNSLINWAATRGDTMIIVDGPEPDPNYLGVPNYNDIVTNNYLTLVQTDPNNILLPSTYTAVYAPWLQVQDPSSVTPGATIYVPPGGPVLGRFNATDTLTGPWMSPAGAINGVVKAISLETRFSNANLDTLSNAQVNAIKLVPGVGFAIWGARTLHPGYPDRYVAIRRMTIKLEHDFKYICRFALFQPNDADLWAQITAVLQNYLVEQLQAGALGGDTPENSFQVLCDDTINPPSTALAGIVNAQVAVSLLSPAEFIYITLSQYQQSQTQQTQITTIAP